MDLIINQLSKILADTYTFYLKTQNYHWHVTGPNFKELHDLFEVQYNDLAIAVDDVAERIRIKGFKAPATLKEFENLRSLQDGNSELTSNKMLDDIHNDHLAIVKLLNQSIIIAAEQHDEGTIALLSERIATHEKMAWMILSSK